MVLKRGYVTLLYTVRYGSHTVHRSNYAVLAVRCKFQDSVFLRLTVRCDTVRYGNLLQYYNTVYTTGYTGWDQAITKQYISPLFQQMDVK
jgi:hypothetical protein